MRIDRNKEVNSRASANPAERPLRAAPSHSIFSLNKPVLQARWKEHPARSNHYYWATRGHEDLGTLPSGGLRIDPPALESLVDTTTHRGGDMGAIRTVPDYPEAEFDLLVHTGRQARARVGSFYEGPSEERGLGQQQVQIHIPPRSSSEHTTIFSHMTGGERSSTSYQQSIGTAVPGIRYNILHGMGHGEGGAMTQSADNLASASEGANTEMIPFDKAISGNPDVIVDTSFRMRPGTQRAEEIRMNYFHKNHPEQPFFCRSIDGDRPKPARAEYTKWKRKAELYKKKSLDAADALVDLSRGHPYAKGGKFGWAPKNHPLDNHRRDDDGSSV